MSEKCIVFSDIILETSTLVLISIGGGSGSTSHVSYKMQNLDHRPRGVFINVNIARFLSNKKICENFDNVE